MLATWSAGLLLTLLAVLVVLSTHLLPWLSFTFPQPGTDGLAKWSDLRDPGAAAYEQRLLLWPLVASGLAAAAGIYLVAGTYLLPKTIDPHWTAPAAWATGFSGFLLTLTGTRWLGFYFARRADDAQTMVHLHWAPYLNLVLGLFLLGAAVGWLSRHLRNANPGHRWTALTAATAATGLLLVPLLPLGEVDIYGNRFLLDEFTIAVLGEDQAPMAMDAPAALGAVRITLWISLSIAAGACVMESLKRMTWFPRSLHWTTKANAIQVAAIAAGAAFYIRFVQRLPQLRPEADLTFNPVLPVTLVVLLVLGWVYVRSLDPPSPKKMRH